MYIYTYGHTNSWTHTHAHTHIHTYTHTCTHAHMHTCTHDGVRCVVKCNVCVRLIPYRSASTVYRPDSSVQGAIVWLVVV